MKINRVLFQSVRNLGELDLHLWDEWQARPLGAALLIGPNGSGKTTILTVIASLWKVLGEFIQIENKPANQRFHFELNTHLFGGFAAIEVIGFDDKTIWVCAGIRHDCGQAQTLAGIQRLTNRTGSASHECKLQVTTGGHFSQSRRNRMAFTGIAIPRSQQAAGD